MPLIYSKSPKAIGKNIDKEEEAGKPHKQALAIALAVQRKAKGHKMAEGGMVEEPESMMDHEETYSELAPKEYDDFLSDEGDGEGLPEEDHDKKILDKIMKRIHSGV